MKDSRLMWVGKQRDNDERKVGVGDEAAISTQSHIASDVSTSYLSQIDPTNTISSQHRKSNRLRPKLNERLHIHLI